MTPRLIMQWLRVGTITVMVCGGALLIVLLIAYAMATLGASHAATLDHAHKVWALSALLGWTCAGLLLATGLWMFLETMLACFTAKGGGRCKSPR
jgi:hypothetical protein